MSELVGVVNAGDTATLSPGAAANETADIPLATESAASGTEDKAGDSQESSEGGSANDQGVRQRGPSKMDTIRQLRQERREMRSYWEQEVAGLKQQLDELKSGFQSGRQGQKPSKTFWEAPEEVNRSIIQEELRAMREEMRKDFQETRTNDQQTNEWKQETSEATKFIQGQKGLTLEDEEDIAEIVRSTPAMQNMRPIERAKYAWFLWKEDKGITDNSAKKARASTIVGAPPAAGGLKNWTKAEMETEINKFPPNPKDWTEQDNQRYKSLDSEFKRAFREGRVK